jgi:hypothetical protein
VRALTSSRGQTSAEYLGGLLLIAAIVIVIVSSGFGGEIRGGIQCAVTRITGGACEDDVALPNGEPLLSDCVRDSAQRGISGTIRIVAFDFGAGVEGLKEIRADGTVKVTIKGNAKAGLNFGADVGIKAGDKEAGIGSNSRVGVTGSIARAWVFKDNETADTFIDDVKRKVVAIADPMPNFPGTSDDADIELPPHDESTIQGGVEVRSKSGSSGVQTVEFNAGAVIGRTVNTDSDSPDYGDETTYFEVSGGVLEDNGLGNLDDPKLMLFKLAASGQAKVRFAYTVDKHGEPKYLRATGTFDVTGVGDVGANVADFKGKDFRTFLDRLTKRKVSRNGGLGGRAVLDARLDLRDPENRDAALGFFEGHDAYGAPVSRVDALLDLGGRLATDSTINARFYSLATHKVAVGFSAGVFGVSGEYTSEDANLVDAFYRPAGGDAFGFERWDSCVH